MVNYPTILNLPQEDINRQLYEMIVKLQKENSGDDSRLDALESAVGGSTSGLVKAVADIEDAIGADNEATTIKGRIYALEHPATSGTG